MSKGQHISLFLYTTKLAVLGRWQAS